MTNPIPQHIETLFPPEDRERARCLLLELDNDRCRIAALKLSDSSIPRPEEAVKLGRLDFRDLLVAARFANDVNAHLYWKPLAHDEPAQIDVEGIARHIRKELAARLLPIGFVQDGDEWRRKKGAEQTLKLLRGLTSRVEARFFLRLRIEGVPRPILLQLPRLGPAFSDLEDQGYTFRAGHRAEDVYEAIARDVSEVCVPWLERFTNAAEVERGHADGTFRRHLPVQGTSVIL